MEIRLQKQLRAFLRLSGGRATAKSQLQQQLIALYEKDASPAGRELEEFIETRCSAKTRKGTPCRRKGNGRGGRCPNHGGLSTGPRTPEGRLRSLRNLRQYRDEDGGPGAGAG